MKVTNQEQSKFYMSQGYSGSFNDRQAAFYNGGLVADATSKAQKIRALTDTTGAYTWVFPIPYPPGVIPAIQLTVESSAAGAVWNHNVVSVNETQVKVQITKTNSVTVVGVSVLGIVANPQAYVHINAAYPTV